MLNVIITAPSLDPTQNVSGVSSVVQFIIDNNRECKYHHFELGKKDKERGGMTRVFSIMSVYRRWKKTINDNRSEKIIVHYSFPLSAPSILRDPMFMHYALKRKVPMVVHIHGGLFLTAPKIPWVLMKILKWVFSWNVPFIVLSEVEKNILMNRFGAKNVEVLPNCVDLKDAEKYRDENLEFRDKGLAADEEKKPLVLGYLGRIEPNKGMTELLEACKILKAEGIQYKLVFAGKEQTEGEYLPEFEKLNDGENHFEIPKSRNSEIPRFRYVGLVSGESKCKFLCSLDAFIMPTYFEGLPMSLLECMSYGKVPVITPVGSVPTVVSKDNGMFIKVKDVKSIVKAVKYLDSNRDALCRLGENACKTIFDKFSPSVYVEKLNRIYQKLYS